MIPRTSSTRTHRCARPGSTKISRNLATLSAAADEYGVSVKTIRRRIADGTLTGYRIGPRLIRVDLNELAAALTIKITTTTGCAR